MYNSGGPPFPPEAARELSAAFTKQGRIELAEQMLRVVIPLQALRGTPESFSFLAYPWPALTYEQRQAMELAEWDRVMIEIDGGSVGVDLCDFGQVNWFYVDRMPELYSAINLLMKAS
jgi:hypothetical protein